MSGTGRIAILVAVLAVAGCGSDERSSPVPATAPKVVTTQAAAPDPAIAGPEAIAVQALHEIYSYKPASEQPGDALKRARQWLGPNLTRVVDTPVTAGDAPKTTMQWTDWARAGATIEAFTYASGEKPPTDPPDRIQRKIGIEQVVTYPDGRTEQLPMTTVVATVVQTPQGWRLDDYR